MRERAAGKPFSELSDVTFDHRGVTVVGHLLLDALEDAGYSVDDFDAVGALNVRLQPPIEVPGGLEAKAHAALTAYFGFMKEQPAAARIVLFEVLGVSAEIDGIYREVIAQFAALLRKHLGLKDATLMSGGLVGAAVQIATQWVLGGFAQPQRAVVDSCARIFLAVAREG